MKNMLLRSLQTKFPNLPAFVIKKMCEKCEEIEKSYSDCIKFSFSVIPRRLESFEDIIETANLISGYSKRYKTNPDTKSKLFSNPTNFEPVELVLVQGMRPFTNSWCEIIENPHPSLLIDAMKILTSEKLAEMGIPHYVTEIVLPTSPDYAFINEYNKPCFASISINEESTPIRRRLTFTNMSATGNVYATLLRKVS